MSTIEQSVLDVLKRKKTVTLHYTYTDAFEPLVCKITKVKEFEGDIIVSVDDFGVPDIEIDASRFDKATLTYDGIGIKYVFS